MRWTVLVLLAAVLATQPGIAHGDEAQLARFVESCEAARRGLILQLEHELRGLAKDRGRTAEAQRLQQRLARLRSGEEVVVPTLRFPVQVGEIGKLPGGECYVDQVISDNELLVRCFFPVVVATIKNFQRYRTTTTQSVQFVLRGPGLPEAHEGQEMDVAVPWTVVGRERYAVEGGGEKSVLVLTPFDLESVRPQLERARVGR
jgi:hypothetical protein